MQGDKQIIELLNEQLTSELTAINQYFLHAKMQENWGYTKLAEHTRAESFEEMRHAERLTERILFLEGLPNYQRLGTLHIGQTVEEQLRADLDLELGVIRRLRPAITLMREKGDITSARIFEDILENEEEHIDYLETELGLIEALGEQLYLARYARPRSSDD
ncbi:bacterioferritin [Thermocatellispora tengchongensis]|uniref:Bacterioferritin n=1 Tax=Thermocatellispora tengchongensis TaxID=1073253 RepID=A0A840P814_9ACTN|nr:bacterioferritin [Thermocatellispora tengchongensis]MBB5134746.1 bacterioferritin [Thermocatellispora tengchongensis]